MPLEMQSISLIQDVTFTVNFEKHTALQDVDEVLSLIVHDLGDVTGRAANQRRMQLGARELTSQQFICAPGIAKTERLALALTGNRALLKRRFYESVHAGAERLGDVAQ